MVKAHLARLAALAASIVVLAPSILAAAETTGIGVITTLSGQATVARLALAQPLPLRFRDNVFVDDRISTAERSTVRVLLGGKALVTVRELSNLTITEDVNRSTVTLNSGKIAVGVAHQRMKPGETLEIRTANAIAAVRGTVLVVEVIGAKPSTTNVHVLHGLVDVFPGNAPGGKPLQIGSLQSFIGSPGGSGQVRSLTPAAAQALFADLHSDPQFSTGSDGFLAGLESREQERAAALAQFISDIRSGRGASVNGCSGASCAGLNNPTITPCTTGNCSRPVGGSGGQQKGPQKSGRAITTYNNQTINVGGNFYTVSKAGNVNLSQPLLETTGTTLNVGGALVDVKGTLAANDANHPFIFLDPTTLTATGFLATTGGGSMTASTTFLQDLQGTLTLGGDALSVTGNSSITGTGASPFLGLDGSTMTVAGNILTAKAPGSTATFKGTLLEMTNGAAATAQKLVDVNSALLDASLPLLALSGNSAFTSKQDLVDLGGNAVARLASIASLNAGILTIKSGAAMNLAGGSVASVAGDLFTLANKSVLTVMNGPLLSLAGGSSLSITGSLLSFIGVGNTVSITNNLCGGACPLIGGIPVFIRGGGTVSITNPIKNAAGNTITYSSPSAALVSVTGGASNLSALGK